jgi:hypothetical protein
MIRLFALPVRFAAILAAGCDAGDAVTLWYDPAEATPVPD